MHILTTMNYTSPNEIIMCKAWLVFAKRFNPTATITIFHHDSIASIARFAKRFTDIHFHRLSKSDIKQEAINGFTDHPTQELRLGVWKQTEKQQIHKYIYVDADAFILSSLSPWWSCIDDKPYIAIHEQTSPNNTFFNAGVHSYSSKTGFITYKKLLDQYRRDGNRIIQYAGEQGLVNNYLAFLSYEFTHPAIDFTYNCIAKFCITNEVSDARIHIVSGNYTAIRRLLHRVTNPEGDWWENWAWWNRNKRINILHAFGKGLKFWELPECQTLWNYCNQVAT